MGEYREHVTISGDASDYEAALAGASAKTKAAASSWSTSLTNAGRRMDAVGKKMVTTGRSMTTYLTLPLAGVGVAATKMALDFDMAFKQIQGLAGDTGISLDQMKTQVLGLAGKTGQAPLDLAKALYFVASASDFAAKHAFPILTLAAKGAEIGMGSVDQVAQTLTKTLNAYRGTGLGTANIMNIITAAAKASATEVGEFAAGLGPVAGVAAAAGIPLNDLVAALATVVNAGIPFDRAVTGIRFVLQNLTGGSAAVVSALKDLGFTSDWLYKQLSKPGGLESALQAIYEKSLTMGEAGRAAFAKITGGSRGMIVVADMVGKHFETTTQMVKTMFEAAQDGAKNFDEAFKTITTDNPAIAMQKMIAGLKVAAIQLGEVLIPILVDDIIPAVKKAVHWFTGLSDESKRLFVKIAIGVAAGGPLLMFAGALARVGGAALKLVGGIGKLAGAGGLGGLAGLLSPGGVLIGGLALLSVGFAQAKLDAIRNEGAVKNLTTALLAGKVAIEDVATKIQTSSLPAWAKQKFQTDLVAEANRRATRTINNHIDAILAGTGAEARWSDALKTTTEASLSQRDKLATLIATTAKFNVKIDDASAKTLAWYISTGQIDSALSLLRNRLLGGLFGALKNLLSYEERLAGSAADMAQKHLAAAGAIDAMRAAAASGGGGGGGGGDGGGGSGGSPQQMHSGGRVPGVGEVPAILQTGEFVVSRRAAQRIGMDTLMRLNRMHAGGAVLASAGAPTRAGVTSSDRVAVIDEERLARLIVASLRANPSTVVLDRKRFTRAADQDWAERGW